MKKAHVEDDSARIETLVGLCDDVRELGTWCVIGRHLVPIGISRTTERGTMVCPECAKTEAGKKALTVFDPTR